MDFGAVGRVLDEVRDDPLMETLGQIVEGNVGLTVFIFGMLWAALVLQGQVLLWFVRREAERLTKHVDDEEEIWEMIRATDTKLHDIETKFPNGDLKVALVQVESLRSAFDQLALEVREHNREAEMWKRKIEVQDVRIDKLEDRS